MKNAMYPRKKSISHILLFILLSSALLPFFLIGYLWISHEYSDFYQEAQTVKQNYIESRKALIQNETRRVINYIQYHHRRTEERLKQHIREQVYAACAMCDEIYQQHQNDPSPTHIRHLLVNALKNFCFKDGRGYFFAIDLDGVAQCLPYHPSLEQTNLLDRQDTRHTRFVKDLIDMVKHEKEGYYHYRWHKPGDMQQEHFKISFVKHFEPLNWLIGTGEYLEDIRNDIENGIMPYIESIRFGEDRQGYIFILKILDFEGGDQFATLLVNPNRPDLVGKPLSDNITDADGKYYLKAFIEGIRTRGETFVRYRCKKWDHQEPIPQISYLKLSPEWNYVVGAGINLDHIDSFIQRRHQILRQTVNRQVGHILLIMLALIVVITLITLYLTAKIRHNFHLLLDFCDKAVTTSRPIDAQRFGTREFEQLARAANQMLDKQEQAKKALNASRKELEQTVEARTAELMRTNHNLHTQIEERLQTEAMLRVERDNLSNILKTMKNGVCIIDRNHNIQYANPEVLKTFGPINDRKCYEYCMNRNTPCNKCFMQNVSYGELLDMEWSPPHQKKIYRVLITPLQNTDGTFSTLKIFHDITRLKNLQKELLCHERLATTGRLAASIAHEINSPLQGITSLLYAMQNSSATNEEQTENLALLNNAIDSIRQIARKLRDLNRPVEEKPQPFDMNAVIKNTASLVRTWLRKNRIHLELTLCPEPVIVQGNPQVMGQVFLNLINNAVEAIQEKREERSDTAEPKRKPFEKIGFKTRIADNEVRISVSDSGPGIPEASAGHIFESFYTTKNEKGMGIGLSICQEIIHDHGGTIKAAGQPEGGTLFTIRLPLAAV